MACPTCGGDPCTCNVTQMPEPDSGDVAVPPDLAYDIGVMFGYNDPPPEDSTGIIDTTPPAEPSAPANDDEG